MTVDVRARTTLPPAITTPALARAFACEAVERAAAPVRTDDVALVVSELVTNAVVHGRGDVTLDVVVEPDVVHVEVTDADPGMAAARPAPHSDAGRGLLLVARVARRWGVRRAPAGKVVWADVRGSDQN